MSLQTSEWTLFSLQSHGFGMETSSAGATQGIAGSGGAGSHVGWWRLRCWVREGDATGGTFGIWRWFMNVIMVGYDGSQGFFLNMSILPKRSKKWIISDHDEVADGVLFVYGSNGVSHRLLGRGDFIPNTISITEGRPWRCQLDWRSEHLGFRISEATCFFSYISRKGVMKHMVIAWKGPLPTMNLWLNMTYSWENHRTQCHFQHFSTR